MVVRHLFKCKHWSKEELLNTNTAGYRAEQEVLQVLRNFHCWVPSTRISLLGYQPDLVTICHYWWLYTSYIELSTQKLSYHYSHVFCSSPQSLLSVKQSSAYAGVPPSWNGLQTIEILKLSSVYLKTIRGKHCHQPKLQELHSYWNPWHESRTAVQLPKEPAPEAGLLGHPALLVTAGLQQLPDSLEEFTVATKRVKALALPTDSTWQRKCHH